MGQVVSVLCSSHSPALMLPYERWQTVFDYIQAQRQAPPPDPVPARLNDEPPALTARKHAACLDAVAELRARFQADRPDLTVIFGDDQEENFQRTGMPPFAMFTGERTFCYPLKLLESYFKEPPGERVEVRGTPEVAGGVITGLYEQGFDVAYAERLPDERWGLPHSAARLVGLLGIDTPVLPVFVNALYEPAATPGRCYALGQAFHSLLERSTPDGCRIVVIGSGGLSHTPRGDRAGYINAEHDAWVIETLRAGRGRDLGQLSTDELWQGANHELREWLPAIAMVGERPPAYLDYVLSWRMIAGYGFGHWSLN